MIRTTPAILSSVWGDMVRSISCRFNPDTGAISDVQTTEFHSPDDIPQSQFVTVDGHQYAVERNENGDLATIEGAKNVAWELIPELDTRLTYLSTDALNEYYLILEYVEMPSNG